MHREFDWTIMAKQATTLELALPARDPATPAYRWLYECVRSAILDGRIRPGSRLPSTRDLGVQYGLSRGTIVLAFDHLASEGYVEGSVGSGTYVTRTLPDDLLRVAPTPAAGRTPSGSSRRLSAFARGVTAFPGYETRPTRAFRANVPALDLFPMALWTKVTARRLRAASVNLLLGAGPTGYRPLQEAVSAYLSEARGVVSEPAQVVITSGVQDALDLAARLVLDRGDRVCMEDPGYPGAARAFEAAGARVQGAPVDEEGMTVGAANLRGARLIYVTPGHQFPLGTTMSLGRRLELLEAARRTGALVFEDDYDSEFRYAGRPVPALQGLDRKAPVLFAGSFSKVLFPALRLGYLVVPPNLVDRVSAARSVTGRPPHLEQAVLCDFITAGHFARHLRRMRQVYAERLEVLLEQARVHLRGLLEVSPVQAGLQTAGWLRPGGDGEAAAKSAATRGVEVTPLARYSRKGRAREGLHLGFAALDGAEIRRGVRELAVALQAVRR